MGLKIGAATKCRDRSDTRNGFSSAHSSAYITHIYIQSNWDKSLPISCFRFTFKRFTSSTHISHTYTRSSARARVHSNDCPLVDDVPRKMHTNKSLNHKLTLICSFHHRNTKTIRNIWLQTIISIIIVSSSMGKRIRCCCRAGESGDRSDGLSGRHRLSVVVAAMFQPDERSHFRRV